MLVQCRHVDSGPLFDLVAEQRSGGYWQAASQVSPGTVMVAQLQP